jgi:transcriptional regulator with XRE-family HTH domain
MSAISNIKRLREQLEISQASAADEIGVSRPSYDKIESGNKELTVGQAKKLANMLGVGFDELFGDTFSEATVEYDERKYKDMIRRFISYAGAESDGRIPKTKLAKLLYLADFAWFYDNLEPISGLEYRRIPQGPVPDEYFRVIDGMYESGEIDIRFSGRAMMIGLNDSSLDPHDKVLTEAQDDLIKSISDEWKDARTEAIVNFTHSQDPWRMCAESEIIPYELIVQEDPDRVYKRPAAVSSPA